MMAQPMTPEQVLAQFKKWGVPVRERQGWRTHNRNSVGDWGPVYGVGLHHTGDDAPDTADVKVLWNGRSDLPGPLCHWGMTDEGVAVMIGWGRTNHFGGGDPKVLNAVINESYDKYPPATHEHQGSSGSVDGNPHFYGQETMYSGSHAMTKAAYKSTVLAFAAVCDFHKWTAKSAIGHKEWSDWKVDPGFLDMAKLRGDVQAALNAGPGNWPVARKPALNPGVHKMRLQVRDFLAATNRRPVIKAAAAAFDNVLAKYERG